MKPKQETQRYGLDALSFAAERGQRYAGEISERRVAPTEPQIRELSKFHEAFPENSSDPRGVVAMLDEFGSPATVATAGGRYFGLDRKSTRLNSSHANISYAVFCLKKKKK